MRRLPDQEKIFWAEFVGAVLILLCGFDLDEMLRFIIKTCHELADTVGAVLFFLLLAFGIAGLWKAVSGLWKWAWGRVTT